MKRIGLIFGLSALLFAAPLAACSNLQATAQAVAVSATHTTPAQSNAVAAAGDAYVLVANAAAVYVRTVHPAQPTKDKIKQLNDAAYAALNDLRAAVKRDDSPAVALALQAWNGKFGGFKAFLTQLGVPLPAGT